MQDIGKAPVTAKNITITVVDIRDSKSAFVIHGGQAAQARLAVLWEELKRLFDGIVGSGQNMPFALMEASEPQLIIHPNACVTFDTENGLYVFSERAAAAGILFATESEERLLDQIVTYLASGVDGLSPNTVNDAVNVLVGERLEDVERALIVQTMCHCNGNRIRAASILGISLKDLQGRLQNRAALYAKMGVQ